MTTEEKLHLLTQAVMDACHADVPLEVGAWQDDPQLGPLVTALRMLEHTRRSQQEKAVQEERELYLQILSQLPADFAILDQHSRYIFLSPVAVRDPEMRAWLIGKTDLDFCNFRNIERSLAENRLAKHEEAFRTGLPTQILEVRQTREGKMEHKLRHYIPITNKSGQHILVGYCHDITELAMHEQSLRDQNEALSKANYELDQFVYRASHDLRAPLASVQGLLDLAMSAEDFAAAQPYLQLMLRATSKMDAFIRDIVDHSKNARQELHIEPMDLQAELGEVMAQLAFMSGGDRVEVQVNIQADAQLYSDRFRIGILLNNLISNGIKYHDPKKETPYVKVDAHVAADRVTISVQDNGIGIAPQHLAHVFEMFYRATNVATGTGIGLYIVQEVAHKLGGSATLNSELGVGTRFDVWFPNGKLPETPPNS